MLTHVQTQIKNERKRDEEMQGVKDKDEDIFKEE